MDQVYSVIERTINFFAYGIDRDPSIFFDSRHIIVDWDVHILASYRLMHQALKAVGLDFKAEHWTIFEVFDAHSFAQINQVVLAWINQIIDGGGLIPFRYLQEYIDGKSQYK